MCVLKTKSINTVKIGNKYLIVKIKYLLRRDSLP